MPINYQSFGNMPAPVKKDYSSDPRLLQALQSMQQDSGPVQSWGEGLAKALSKMVGGYQAKQVKDEYQQLGDDYQKGLAKALTTSQTGVPAWNNPDNPSQELIPAIPPGSESLVAGLSSSQNPYLQETMSKVAMDEITRKQKNSDTMAMKDYDYTKKRDFELDPQIQAAKLARAKASGTSVVINDPFRIGKEGQKKLDEGLMDTSSTLAGMNAIKSRFKPEFLELGTRWNNMATAGKEKLGYAPDPKDQKNLAEYSQFKAEAGQFYANTIKKMAGTAVSEREAALQQTYLPDPGTGTFDGDSPTQFKSKVQRFEEFSKNAMARLAYAKKNGLSISIDELSQKVPLEQMPRLIQERGKQIEAQMTAQNPGADPRKIQEETAKALADEFGLSYQ